MAFVAEAVGAQPIDFKSGVGEVIKGADQAASIYAAKQKADIVKMKIEDMQMEQDKMKVGISIDYLDKINNAANPTVKKILMKQFGNQFQKMYGQPLDNDTLNAITASPDFGASLDALKQTYNTGLAGKFLESYSMLFKKGLTGPYAELPATLKATSDIALQEQKMEQLLNLALARSAQTQTRFETSMAGKKEENVLDKIRKTTDPLNTGYNQLLNAKKALDSNDYQKVSGILSVLAKNVGADAGALSNQDLNRWLPSTFEGDMAKVEAYVSSTPSQELDPKLTRGLKQLVRIAANNMVDRYGGQLGLLKDEFKATPSYQGIQLDQMFNPAERYIKDLKDLGGFGGKPGALQQKMTGPQLIKAGIPYKDAVARFPKIAESISEQEYNDLLKEAAGNK